MNKIYCSAAKLEVATDKVLLHMTCATGKWVVEMSRQTALGLGPQLDQLMERNSQGILRRVDERDQLPPQSRPGAAHHPSDYRDAIEHAEVQAILAELPRNDRARIAYESGAREASDSVSLAHLLGDRPDLGKRLMAAYRAHADRIWGQSRGSFGV